MLNFTKAQYEEIWDMIFQITGYPPHHPKHESKSKKEEHQWEILSFRGIIQQEVVWSILQNGKYKYSDYPLLNEEYTLEYMLDAVSDGNIKIESVKRFPDNTVWSVDMVTGQGKIKKFQVIGKNMLAEVYETCYTFNIDLLTEAPKEEQVPIKVSRFERDMGNRYVLILDNPIPESKYQPIKEAIEKILNNEDWTMEFAQKMVKEVYAAELLQARRDAFDAARKIVFMFSAFPIRHPFKYLKFEDYINSLK